MWSLFIYIAMCIYRPRAKITKIAILSFVTLMIIEVAKLLASGLGMIDAEIQLGLNIYTAGLIPCYLLGLGIGAVIDKINFHYRSK